MMNYKEQIVFSKIPNHIAIIMDGNGRWAKKKGMQRVYGHKNGVNAVRETIEAAVEVGVKVLTLYAFSSDNWNRPKLEVQNLMSLLMSSFKNELSNLQKNNIKLRAIGDIKMLPDSTQKELLEVIEKTKTNSKITVTLALSYGGRDEILKVVKELLQKVINKELNIEEITEKTVNHHLYTFNLPDVDLIIRTSGEQRLSNFLLWQIAYSEFYFTETLWPDFTKEDFYKAVYDYQQRQRRFGKTGEQIKKK